MEFSSGLLDKKRWSHQFLGWLNSNSIFKGSKHHEMELLTIQRTLAFPLDELNIVGRMPLGKRIEEFFNFYTHHSTEYNVIAKSVQVFTEKITIGEFDFLLKDMKTDGIIHLELVFKFYLYDPEAIGSEYSKWIGPNRNDNLEYKLNKLQNKQFPLLQTPEATHKLKALEINSKVIKQKLGFNAFLFLPLAEDTIFSEVVNKECLAGWWGRVKDLENHYSQSQFFIPEKQDWTVSPNECNIWFDLNWVKTEIQNMHEHKKSPLIWVKHQNKTGIFFIVWW